MEVSWRRKKEEEEEMIDFKILHHSYIHGFFGGNGLTSIFYLNLFAKSSLDIYFLSIIEC